jgi:succinate dehydrogenase/fumarate reductase flavoprotein subunit
MQKARFITDSKELMYKDIMASGLDMNDKDLVRILVDQSKEAFDWSINYLEVPYLDRVDQFGGHSVARCYTAFNTTGASIIKKQVEKVTELGIPFKKQTYFKTFILDAAGKVIGGIFREGYDYKDAQKGKDIYVKSNKAIILATGGFRSDVAFRR